MRHPQCEEFGIQQLVTHESIPEDATVVRTKECTSAYEFRKTLTHMDDSVECILLSKGVDGDGTVHENEVVMFRRLSTHREDAPLENMHVMSYHFSRWRRAAQPPLSFPAPTSPTSPSQIPAHSSASPSTSSTSQSEPSWLTEAEIQVEVEGTLSPTTSTRTPPVIPSLTVGLPDIPETHMTPTPPPSVVPTHNTIFVHDSTVVLTIDGVITPNVLMSLAQPNSVVYIPTRDGVRMALTRVRNAIWFGTYVVDTTSWAMETRTYKVTTHANHNLFAPRRSVAQMHRLRRRQFERR